MMIISTTMILMKIVTITTATTTMTTMMMIMLIIIPVRDSWEIRKFPIGNWEFPFFPVVCVRNYWMIQMSANTF